MRQAHSGVLTQTERNQNKTGRERSRNQNEKRLERTQNRRKTS
nr:MAG TPA: hypothetical protein [Caudoviricetes sp.]